MCNFQKCLPSSSIPSTSPQTALCRRAGCQSWVTSGQLMVEESSVSFMSVRVRGSFFGLLLGTSKMAMLSNSCNFILFLNLCVWFSSIRKYSPACGAVGSAAASDATAIEIAESKLTAENKGLEASTAPTLDKCSALQSCANVCRRSAIVQQSIWEEPACWRPTPFSLSP